MAKVYVKLDDNKVIVDIDSDVFLTDTNGYIEIDEGEGDKYALAQNHYLTKDLTTNGIPNFKYVDGTITELTADEKNKLFPKVELVDDIDELKSRQDATEQALQDLILATLKVD